MRSRGSRINRRLINTGLLAALVIAAVIGVFAATSGGKSTSSGDARACDAFWTWYNQTGSAAPMLTAYQEATSEPLAGDLRAVAQGLQAQATAAGQDETASQALTQGAALKAEGDCVSDGYANPLS
jgi:hypothetical protein